jgi:pyruvate/2-oxoglutarate dehydrogenase complex dihydrolipoamide dehydrogenase (E3) component
MSASPVVAVVGAGPVGLAAAAELLEYGVEPIVMERGRQAGSAVTEWGPVRLFSPWSELVAPAAGRLLGTTGWQHPDRSAYPTGDDWVDAYLRPLAAALGTRVRFAVEVVGVARRGRDRVVDAGRDTEPLTVHLRRADGTEERLTVDGLIDASGTWSRPNPLGGDGLPATGESAARPHVAYRIPDLSSPAVRARYAGKHVVVAGSGHSALTALIELASMAIDEPSTRVSWVLRRGAIGDTFGGGSADQLPARGALGQRARQVVSDGVVDVVTGLRVEAVESRPDGVLTLVAQDGRRVENVDEVVALTGFRPDLTWLSEVRLELDHILQAPVRLAPLIDPNVHSCGTVPPHGVAQLAHPEPNVYLAGMKSYGRAPTFLAMTGYEQVRSIAAAYAGDRESAERVELALPESGVCGGAGLFDQADADQTAGCCAAPEGPQLVDLAGLSSNP